MRAKARLAAIAAALFAGLASASAAAADQPDKDPSVSELMARVGAYVVQFEREFQTVVAEERYVQILKPWTGVPTGPDEEPALTWDAADAARFTTRRIRSDVLLVQVRDGTSIAYRDVFEVDGRPIRDRDERMKELFLSGEADSLTQLRQLTAESARYNLGEIVRTINTPAFPLAYFHPRFQSRVRFSRKGTEDVDSHRCAIVEFRERERPALVATPTGGGVLASGRLWAEPATGRIRRIDVRLDQGASRRRMIQVTFDEEPGIEVLVPRRMWEWYEGADMENGRGAGTTYVEGLATYSNIRRFTVTAQIKKP